MRKIDIEDIKRAVCDLFLKACISPPQDVIDCLEKSMKEEKSSIGKEIFSQLLENAEISKRDNIPYCQDTGMAIVFLDIGQDVHIVGGDLKTAVNDGIREAYERGYFRKSVLSPLGRVNTGDNTPGIIHIDIVPGDKVTINVSPKGFGSENMSQIKMLKPSQGVEGVIDFVVESAKMAGGNPCPPVILGVGIGGSFEKAALMAKRQLLREVGSENPSGRLNELEKTIMEKINSLGMGPMGFEGNKYCLAVHIEEFETHLAGLPVAVNYVCHALRHASVTL